MFQLMVGTDFPFMKYRRIAYVISGAMMLATAIWLLVNRGPRLSVDFTGGTLVQIRTTNELPADRVRAALEAAGFHGFELQQLIGESRNEFFVRFPAMETADPYPLLERAIKSRFPQETVELRRTEAVGPKVGSELRRKAFGRTGATVIAISRGKDVVLVPDGHELLKAGDVVALAGTRTAIEAARELLIHGKAR